MHLTIANSCCSILCEGDWDEIIKGNVSGDEGSDDSSELVTESESDSDEDDEAADEEKPGRSMYKALKKG